MKTLSLRVKIFHSEGKLFSCTRILFFDPKWSGRENISFDISSESMHNILGNKLNDITFLLWNGCAEYLFFRDAIFISEWMARTCMLTSECCFWWWNVELGCKVIWKLGCCCKTFFFQNLSSLPSFSHRTFQIPLKTLLFVR